MRYMLQHISARREIVRENKVVFERVKIIVFEHTTTKAYLTTVLVVAGFFSNSYIDSRVSFEEKKKKFLLFF